MFWEYKNMFSVSSPVFNIKIVKGKIEKNLTFTNQPVYILLDWYLLNNNETHLSVKVEDYFNYI